MAATSPSKPHLTDEYEPTDPELWQRVLLVARGRLREFTTRNRTIHSPNNGMGFRHWPNPKAVAWAVKQYNGFEGGWTRKQASIADRVAARWVAAQDLSEGVIDKADYARLENKHVWKGYWYKLSEHVWNDAGRYEEAEEPDDWGDNRRHGPVMVLEDVLNRLAKAPFKWTEWLGDFIDSKPKRAGKSMVQAVALIERVDGRRLSHEEREFIESRLRLRS